MTRSAREIRDPRGDGTLLVPGEPLPALRPDAYHVAAYDSATPSEDSGEVSFADVHDVSVVRVAVIGADYEVHIAGTGDVGGEGFLMPAGSVEYFRVSAGDRVLFTGLGDPGAGRITITPCD